MPSITLEQALFVRPEEGTPRLLARSANFRPEWVPDAEDLMLGFGARPSEAFRSPALTVFAKLLTRKFVAVVRVRDEQDGSLPTGLLFHFLIVDQQNYMAWIRDPFLLAEKLAPTWDVVELPALSIATEAFSPRTVGQVQEVLKRVKAAALRQGENPNSPDFERTVDNSESPALLGGAQILVDGGRLVFERHDGDIAMIAGLWLLLPEATRSRLWPTTFAYSADLGFDVLVLPRISDSLDGYTSEEQAADYPQGAYELALQKAAEAGDQKELDSVLSRRDGWQTIKLGLVLLVALSFVALTSRWLGVGKPPPNPLPVQTQKIAAQVGIMAAGSDPWTALVMRMHAKTLWGDQEKKE